MNYVVLHQSKYRLRLHLPHVRMDDRQADLVEYYLKSQPFIKSASVNEQTCNATLCFSKAFTQWEQLEEIFLTLIIWMNPFRLWFQNTLREL